MKRIIDTTTLFLVGTLCFFGAISAHSQDLLLPDLILDPAALNGHEVDTGTIPGSTLLRFDTSIPNIGLGEFRIRATGIDAGSGRETVEQVIQVTNQADQLRDAGDFLYNTVSRLMEAVGWVEYRLRRVLPAQGVGDIVAVGAKQAVNITSSAIFDLDLLNAPDSGDRFLGSGPKQGISVGYTDLYPRFLQFQWVDATGLQSGDYWLEVEVDPANHIWEANETNNVARVIVTLNLEDTDGDGLSDTFEEAIGTDPTLMDTDGDGLTDDVEVGYDGDLQDYDPFNPSSGMGGDLNALSRDTDGDGVGDAAELREGTDPLDAGSAPSLPAARFTSLFLLFLSLLTLSVAVVVRVERA